MPPPRVEHQRVDDPADADVEVLRADLLHHPQRVGARHLDLRERRQVEQRRRLARRAVLAGDVLEPVLAAVAVGVLARRAGRRVPVRALVADRLAEHRAGGLDPVVQRRAADVARRARLQVRPVHGVQPAEALRRAGVQVAAVRLLLREPLHVEAGHVAGRRARHDPLRQRAAGAGRVDDALAVEAGGHVEALHGARLADAERRVGRERLGRVQELRVLDAAQRRDALLGQLPDGREVLPVGLQLAEREARRQRRADRAACRRARTRRPAAHRLRAARRSTRRGRGSPAGRSSRRRSAPCARARAPPARAAPTRPPTAARSRVHRPHASTTRSHSTVPCAVTTAVTRPPACSNPVTSTPSRNVTPRACAPVASARAARPGFTCPSSGW